MKDGSQKELFVILVLTVVTGIGVYFLARMVDDTISEVTETRYRVSELTRIAVDKKTRIEEFRAVDEYKDAIEESMPETEDFISMLEQMETMSDLAGVSITFKLEEGIIGEGDIEFKDENEKMEFLNSLKVQEFNTDGLSQDTSTQSAPGENVVLQLMEDSGGVQEERVSINYIEISLGIRGGYKQIRTFIDLLQSSKYFFNVKEVRLNSIGGGTVEGNLGIRAFIFEQS